MKLVEIIPSFRRGGVEMFVAQLCIALKKNHLVDELWLITLEDEDDLHMADELLRAGCKVKSLNKKHGFHPNVILSLWRLLGEIKPQCVHAHMSGLCYALLPCLFMSIKKKIYTAANEPEKEGSRLMFWGNYLAFKLLGWKPIALSEGLRFRTEKSYDVPVHHIPYGICPVLISEPRLVLRERYAKEFAIANDAQIILNVAEIRAQKDHRTLIKSFSEVAASLDCYLLIAGKNSLNSAEKDELNKELSILPNHISKRILFLGDRNDIASLMTMSDVFVLSSSYEGLPLVVLEAMAYEIPIVSTKAGAVQEVLGNSGAIFVDCGDALAMADAIRYVLTNQQVAQSITRYAKELFNKYYTISTVSQKYYQYFSC
ncbi:MAG: glycosyltransferase [Candidatus Omnitrophica bacterium]|nr:glycosyltransferase [Candidatus Omnitrophota bacterium]